MPAITAAGGAAQRHRTHCLAYALFKLVSGIDQVLSTTGAPQKVCDSVRLNRIENSFVPNVPQTDAGAGNGSERQRKHQPLQ